MEVMESISPPELAQTSDECVFDHSPDEPEDIANELEGVGTTLGEKMTQGKGTFSMSIDHLEICPPTVQDKVIKDTGYKAEADED